MTHTEMLKDARCIAKSLGLTVVKYSGGTGYYIINRKTKNVEYTVKSLSIIYEQLLAIM